MHILFWIAFVIIAYSYILYPMILPLLVKAFGRKIGKNDVFFPSVAVIIPVYNEEAVIRAKINNILALDYPPERLSIFVGSDCSTDTTHDIVRSMTNPQIHLWIAPCRGGKTEVLNYLVPTLKQMDVVLFTDANTMHDANSLKMLVRSFVDPTVGGVAGHIMHQASKHDLEEVLYRSFESRQKEMESRLHSCISAFGGFYAIRHSLFKPIPHNSYSNDDVLIPMNVIRQKFRIIFEPEAISREDMSESIATEFSRRIRIGAGNFQAFFWLLDFLNPLRGWPSYCYISHKVTRWFSPFLFGYMLISGLVLWLYAGSQLFGILTLCGIFLILIGLSDLIVPAKSTRPILYFLSMNTALLFGFIRYCSGIRSAAWSRTERDAEK